MNNEIPDNKDDKIVFLMVHEVENAIRENRSVIDKMIKMVLFRLNLDKDTELRRDWDGVSSAEYMAEKMIGEYLANGKSKR